MTARVASRPPIAATPPAPPQADCFMTQREVADLLRLSTRTVRALAIPHVRIGRTPRYVRSEVIAWTDRQRANTPPRAA